MTLRKKSRALFLTAFVALLIPVSAQASSIQIYSIPVHMTHQDYLCIFAGTSGCPQDPAGFTAPVTDTNGNFPMLTHNYTGTSLTNWSSFVGPSFVLGLDVNSATHQTLTDLTITFFDASNNIIGPSWTFAPLLVPDIHNGEGWADYVLAAGCAGSTFTTAWPIDACTQYLPFVAPAGTAGIGFTFGFGGTGNDGHDDLFAIPYTDRAIPEPGTLLLLATGLTLVARRLRRRVS
jgi:hypothetical protein